MRVEQNNFRDMFSVYLSGPPQTQHVFCVSPAARVAHAGLAGEGNREREIDHLQAQLDKLRRMNFGSRSEKVSRRIAQMEADLNRLQKESDRERYADW